MSDGPAVLDQAVVAELRASVGGDDAFVRELANAYLAEGTTHLDAMAEALGRDAVADVVRPAHTLKSSSAALGAVRLAEISRRIEHAARDGTVEGLGDALDEARAVWALTEEAMRAEGLA
jgi:HPt (histidine-containing phosphotransfer) domain-containing protein